jgi:hypothetical protein
MVRRILQGLLAVTLATAGLTVAVQSPAMAVGGCSTNNVTVSSCVNYGSHGHGRARADFYLNRRPDSSIQRYVVYLVFNGHYAEVGRGNFASTGHHCCWYRTLDNLPNTYNSAKTVVSIFTRSGDLHMSVSSPTINFWS